MSSSWRPQDLGRNLLLNYLLESFPSAIRIRKGDAVAELRPVGAPGPPSSNEHLSPREALRCLQTEARLSSGQAQQYLNEVYDERLATEARRPA